MRLLAAVKCECPRELTERVPDPWAWIAGLVRVVGAVGALLTVLPREEAPTLPPTCANRSLKAVGIEPRLPVKRLLDCSDGIEIRFDGNPA